MVEQSQAATPERFTSSFASFLDLSRWVAAMVVFIGHLRNPLVVGYPNLDPADQTIITKAWYFITGLDHEAVLVFFVLSGFLVGGMSLGKVAQGRYDPRGYAIDRIARLFIAFIPAVFLGAALDWWGHQWFGWTGLWDHGSALMASNFPTFVFIDNLGWTEWAGNLLMVQHFFVPPIGSNLPLWTLSFEFWFYVVFGAFAFALVTPSRVGRWAAGLLIVTIIAALGYRLPAWMFIWVIGVFAFLYRGKALERPYTSLLVLGVTLIFSRFWTTAHDTKGWTEFGVDYLVGAAFAWTLISWRGRSSRLLEALGGLNRFMANFSYSLYLLHFPLMLFVLAGLATAFGVADLPRGLSPTDPRAIALYLGTVAIVLPVSWLFAQLTERHTPELRGFLKRRSRRRVVAAA